MSISGLSIGTRALQANQIALEITGQNIANVNTPGYTRQRAKLTPSESLLRSFGTVGTGVQVEGIERIRDAFIDTEIRGQKSDVGAYDVEADIFSRIEQIFNEPTSVGIDSLLSDFFDALADLANSPEDVGIRDAVIGKSQTLTNQIQFVNRELDELRLDVNGTIVNTVTEMNTIIQEIAELNTQVIQFEAGTSHQANDLRDRRDELLKDLSELTTIQATEMETGEVNVSINGISIIFGATYQTLDTQLQTGDELPIHEVIVQGSGSVINFTGGEMYGLFQSRDVNIVNSISDLDQLAGNLIDQINQIHVDGRGLLGFSTLTSVNAVSDAAAMLDSAGLDITPVDTSFDIVVRDESGAAPVETTVNVTVDVSAESLTDVATNINNALTGAGIVEIAASVNANNELVIASSDTDFTFAFANVTDDTNNFLSAIGLNTFFTGHDAKDIDVNDLLVSSPEFVAAATSFAQGDNRNALLMSELRTARILDNNTKTLEEFHQQAMVRLGSDVEQAKIQAEASTDFLTQLELKRESISGVNLDEEAANLIRYQRAFEASARYISVIDQVLNVLVNGLI